MAEIHLSAHAYGRILEIAGTVAKSTGSPTLPPDQVSEAIQLRSLDRQIWG